MNELTYKEYLMQTIEGPYTWFGFVFFPFTILMIGVSWLIKPFYYLLFKLPVMMKWISSYFSYRYSANVGNIDAVNANIHTMDKILKNIERIEKEIVGIPESKFSYLKKIIKRNRELIIKNTTSRSGYWFNSGYSDRKLATIIGEFNKTFSDVIKLTVSSKTSDADELRYYESRITPVLNKLVKSIGSYKVPTYDVEAYSDYNDYPFVSSYFNKVSNDFVVERDDVEKTLKRLINRDNRFKSSLTFNSKLEKVMYFIPLSIAKGLSFVFKHEATIEWKEQIDLRTDKDHTDNIFNRIEGDISELLKRANTLPKYKIIDEHSKKKIVIYLETILELVKVNREQEIRYFESVLFRDNGQSIISSCESKLNNLYKSNRSFDEVIKLLKILPGETTKIDKVYEQHFGKKVSAT